MNRYSLSLFSSQTKQIRLSFLPLQSFSMIRGNYSLAKEVRKNEQKQRQKLQQRQKHEHRMQKVGLLDPIRLYFQIQKLKAAPLGSELQSRLKKLEDDWKFIEKNKLHQEKLKPFLEDQKQKEELKRKAESRLWGKQSIYFNPELNPLGKVPDVGKLPYDVQGPLPNLRIPLKSRVPYSPDPLIETLGVVLPEGPRPQFYKKVQNTKVEKKEKEVNAQVEVKSKGNSEKLAGTGGLKRPGLDSDSEAEMESDDEVDWSKKQRRN